MVLNNKIVLIFAQKEKKPFWSNHTKNHKVFDPYLIIQFFFQF